MFSVSQIQPTFQFPSDVRAASDLTLLCRSDYGRSHDSKDVINCVTNYDMNYDIMNN